MIDQIKKIAEQLNGRTLDEALLYYENCKGCPKYRITYCERDRGCDKEQLFIARLARGYCKARWGVSSKNSIAYRYFETTDLIKDSYKLIPYVPIDTDVIAGGARSGLFPATVLSTVLHRPLLSVGKTEVVEAGGGWRIKAKPPSSYKKIFLAEDTVYSGRSISINIEVLKKTFPEAQILTGVVYVHPKSLDKVDHYVLSLPGRHYLEWNFFNSIAISRCVFDFDGILCEEIPSKDDDDGERYTKALQNAIPKHYVRREPIPVIATARLEKYREITEAWLAKHGMSCKKLVMGPWASNQERAIPGEIAKFKAGVYSSYSYTLFVESNPKQAAEIADLTGKEVLCPYLKRVLVK